MTAREPDPPTPKCPMCESADGVLVLEDPPTGRPEIRWECTSCRRVFTGTPSEYQAVQVAALVRKAEREDRAALLAKLEGES